MLCLNRSRFYISIFLIFIWSNSETTVLAQNSMTQITSLVVADPGVRAGHVDAGAPFSSLSPAQQSFFDDGLQRFKIVDSVSGTIPNETNGGLGPRYNSISCVSCHSQPSPGGSSPRISAYPYIGPNPQVEAATHDGAKNFVPFFITLDGPVREARLKFFLDSNGKVTPVADGGVHALYTISGRPDATNAVGISGEAQTCSITQPDFQWNGKLGNISYRIPTPTFGAGLIENISDRTILENMAFEKNAKKVLGISGLANRNGNDGTITRFGWKAQNKSLQIFSGEAYNVEMGVTSELFQSERPSPGKSLPDSCSFNTLPEDTINPAARTPAAVPSDVVQFSTFMRYLSPPVPSTTSPGGEPSISRGRNLFASKVQCALCHTPSLRTVPSNYFSYSQFAFANLYSDLLVHHWVQTLMMA